MNLINSSVRRLAAAGFYNRSTVNGDPPSTPTGLLANPTSISSITLTWNFAPNTGYFDVYRSFTQNGTYTKINGTPITALTYTDTALTPNTIYWYYVVGTNSVITGDPSDKATATTLNGTVTAQTIKTITLASVVTLTGKPTYFPGAYGKFFDARFHPVAHTEENYSYYNNDMVMNQAKIMVPRQ